MEHGTSATRGRGRRPRIALVLSGGGARGAYETGIVRYLREELPGALGGQPVFDFLCGTSVGGITACFLAATADQPETQGALLSDLWREMALEQVYKVDGEDLWTITRKMWRAATNEPLRPEGWRLYDVLHPEPLEHLVRSRVPWERIAPNLAAGHLAALSVTATDLTTGRGVVWVQRRGGGVPPWTQDPLTEARPVEIGPDHALASAAIPLLFRAVKIGTDYFCDGSLRLNTPLSPALRLGAEKMLVVSLRYRPEDGAGSAPPLDVYPTTPLLMGRVLNALMLDRTDRDLDRLRRTNELLEAGREMFGEDFLPRMNARVAAQHGTPYRIVEHLLLRPSRDIGAIAAQHTRTRLPEGVRATLPTKLLHRIARSQMLTEGDLASYLLFDGKYASELIEMGMEDAHARREELVRFFSEPVGPQSRTDAP